MYPRSGPGVAWNGLVSVMESVDDTTQTITYFDGEKAQNQLSLGVFQATLDAFTYPDEFEPYSGHVDHLFFEQPRRAFNFCYRTLIGDAVDGLARGYKLHLVYNALARPATSNNETLGENSSVSPFSWDLTTTPVPFPGANAGAHLIVDSTKVYPWVLTALENVLYGEEFESPRMPDPDDLLALFEEGSILRITDHGDGTWTADGPSSAIVMLNSTTFEITWPSAIYISDVEYQISSL